MKFLLLEKDSGLAGKGFVQKTTGWQYTTICILAILFFPPPLVIHDEYIIHVLVMSEIWVMLALSLNLIMGYTGQVSMAHGAIYGVGAYTSAVLCMKFGFSFWLSLPIATFLSMVAGALIGLPAFRSIGIHFAIVTMGFGLVLYDIFNNWLEVTGGPMGITNIPAPDALWGITFKSKENYYYLVFGFMLLTIFLMLKLSNSRWGRAFVAIREDEILAKSLGINIWIYKTISMVISSGFAGLAGVLYAHYILFIDPVSFTTLAGLIMIVMAVIGGMGTFLGPIVGAMLMTILPEALRFATEFREAIYGLLLLLFLLFMPAGITVYVRDRIQKGRGK